MYVAKEEIGLSISENSNIINADAILKGRFSDTFQNTRIRK